MYNDVKKKIIQGSKTPTGWDLLIKEAEDRIQELREAIAHFNQNKANGEPYFGELGARFQKGESGSITPS